MADVSKAGSMPADGLAADAAADAEAASFLPEALQLGVPEIDAQHGALFQQLARIKEACLASNHLPQEEASALLQALQTHFATEARWAKSVGDDFSDHHNKHHRMYAAVERALRDAGQSPLDPYGVLRYVEYWFEMHISDDDRNLCRHILARPTKR